MLGVNASDVDGQAIGQKPVGSAGRLQTEVVGFIRVAQLPTKALTAVNGGSVDGTPK